MASSLSWSTRAASSPTGLDFSLDVDDEGLTSAAGKADSISGLETPDDSTLVVTTTQPAGEIPYLFSLSASAPGRRAVVMPRSSSIPG